MKSKLKIRKEINIDIDLQEIQGYIGCNPKGVYYIENNLIKNKFVRYFLFLRRRKVNINRILDKLIEIEDENIANNQNKK